MTEAFDIDAWKAQGQNALQELEKEREELTEKLDAVNDKIDSVKDALGIKREMPSGSGGSKVMIRGTLKQVLIEADGGKLTLDDIVDKVQEEKPEATHSSIETSLARLVRSEENFHGDNDGFWYEKASDAAAE